MGTEPHTRLSGCESAQRKCETLLTKYKMKEKQDFWIQNLNGQLFTSLDLSLYAFLALKVTDKSSSVTLMSLSLCAGF